MHLHFCGEGAKELCQAMGRGKYAAWSEKKGPELSGVDNDFPEPPIGIVLNVAQLHKGGDGLRETPDQFKRRMLAWIVDRSFYAIKFWDWSGPPELPSFKPKAHALIESEGPNIAERIRRDRERGVHTQFVIGNEPNTIPYVDPQDMAEVFVAFQKFIKAHNPECTVCLPPPWAWELTPEDARQVMVSKLHNMAVTIWKQAGLPYNWLIRRFVVSQLAKWATDALRKKVFRYSTPQYIDAMLSRIPPEHAPDKITMHIYTMDIGARLEQSEILWRVADLIRETMDLGWGPPIWVTEFGNANPYIERATVQGRIESMLIAMDDSDDVEEAYFFKPCDDDPLVEKYFPGEPAPFSRGVDDVNYQPDPATIKDNLNELGQFLVARAESNPDG